MTVNRRGLYNVKLLGNVGVTKDQSSAKTLAVKPRSSRITLMLALAALTERPIPSSK
jgi:hypothetical protein